MTDQLFNSLPDAASVKIHMIAAALPPQLDGIGDYTSMLAAEFAHSSALTVFTVEGYAHTPIAGVRIVETFLYKSVRSVWRILDHVRQDRPDWVVLQYQPFAYGRYGLNLHLPELCFQIKRQCPGTRLAVMFHEPFVPCNTLKFAVMTVWQRWQLWRLGVVSDVVFFSIEPWVRRFSRWFPGTPVYHLPVGANVPYIPTERSEARARLGIANGVTVLGLFGRAASGRLLDFVRSAYDSLAANGFEPLFLYIGPDVEEIRSALGNSANLRADGSADGSEVSRRLAAIDIYLAPYSDGVSTRRGAVMAGLQHGLPIASTRGPLTDDILLQSNERALLLSDVDDLEAYVKNVLRLASSEDERARLGAGARRLFEESFTWSKIARRMSEVMQMVRPL